MLIDDERVIAEADDIVAEAEDVSVEDDFNYWVDWEWIALEASDEEVEAVETVEDSDVVDFNAIFEDEEFQNTLSEVNLTNEEAAWLIWLFAGLWMLLIPLGIIGFILRILRIIALRKAFEKAWEGWWKALVPVYSSYIKYKLAEIKNWFRCTLLVALIIWIIAVCIPNQENLINNIGCAITWIIYIVMLFKFARKYGWGVCTSILFVLFYPICILILGFGNSQYEWKKSEETVVEA